MIVYIIRLSCVEEHYFDVCLLLRVERIVVCAGVVVASRCVIAIEVLNIIISGNKEGAAGYSLI